MHRRVGQAKAVPGATIRTTLLFGSRICLGRLNLRRSSYRACSRAADLSAQMGEIGPALVFARGSWSSANDDLSIASCFSSQPVVNVSGLDGPAALAL
jgi:hypothetical protein